MPVQIFTILSPDEKYPVCGAIKKGNGWENRVWTREGKYSFYAAWVESNVDLIEIVEPKTIKLHIKGLIVDIFVDGSVLFTKLSSGDASNSNLRAEFTFDQQDFNTIITAREAVLKQVEEYNRK